MLVDKYKDKIKTALLNRQSKIQILYYNAQVLFQRVLDENPKIEASIKEVQYFGALVGGVFIVKYKEKADVNIDAGDSIFCADTESEVNDILHSSIRKHKANITISLKRCLDIGTIYSSFVVAYQGFYSNLISIGCKQQISSRSTRTLAYFTFEYRIGRVKLTMMETAVNKKIDELNSTIFCDGMPNEVMAFIAHNYLAKTVTYWLDEEAKPLEKSYMQSAYGALINRKCVCQGYAEAYKRILDAQGIVCEVICGKIKGSPDYHAWNVISFDKKNYYHIDVTWDARKCGKERYKYYGLSDADLQSNRIWTRMSNIICNGKENILESARLQLARHGSVFASKGASKEYFN